MGAVIAKPKPVERKIKGESGCTRLLPSIPVSMTMPIAPAEVTTPALTRDSCLLSCETFVGQQGVKQFSMSVEARGV